FRVNDSVYALTGPPVVGKPAPVGPARPAPGQPAPAQPAPARPAPAQPAPSGEKPTFEDLQRQHSADPTAAGPAFGLGQLYRDMGQLDKAVEALAPAVPANPRDIALHHLFGDVLRDAGRYDEAEQAYRDAASAGPTAGNYNKLGFELIRMGRPQKAEDA